MNIHLHLEVIRKVVEKNKNINSILEFGMGEISTFELLNNPIFKDIKIISCETERPWYESIRQQIGNRNNWSCYFGSVDQLISACKSYDNIGIILVDSITIESRIDILNKLRDFNVDCIVLHDSQHDNYNSVVNTYKYNKKILGVNGIDCTIMSNYRKIEDIYE